MNGSGNPNSSHKYSSSRHQKLGTKRNQNGAPPFPVPFPYQQPTLPPVFHAMVPPPHIAVSGYAYQPSPAPFPGVETHLVKSGSDSSTVQPFVPPVNVQTPPRGDPNAFAVNFSNRRPSVQEPGGHLNHAWHQRAFSPRDNMALQQGMGPRPLVRPPLFAPAPGFMVAPTFPGNFSTLFVCLEFSCLLCTAVHTPLFSAGLIIIIPRSSPFFMCYFI